MFSFSYLLFPFSLVVLPCPCQAFVPQKNIYGNPSTSFDAIRKLSLASSKDEWTSDFDGFVGDDNTSLSDFLAESREGNNRDLTAVQTRLFSLGEDLIINDFIGDMGFDEGMYYSLTRNIICIVFTIYYISSTKYFR
jgi:hypothetical protein